MSDDRKVETISALLRERIAAGDFPSAIYLVAERGEIVFADALGHAALEPVCRPATFDTIYDLASLTKPLVTGLVCAILVERGELELDERVARVLPEFDRADKRAITLRQLLTHTSGLPAWLPLYIATRGERADTLRIIAEQTLEYAPGTRVVYSDLGFITLGFIIEKIAGAPLADVAQREIFAPLKLERTFFNPATRLQTEIAACETGNDYERETCGASAEAQNFVGWRKSLIWGEVHDGNAYFLGGAAGHAGLFSTARETLRLASQFFARLSVLLKPETCALFRTSMTEGLDEARSFAWQLAMTKDSTAGASLSPDSFGHLGFTGTSCWNDPARDWTFILLTNRTHAHALPFVNINSVRRRFHTLASSALQARSL